MNLTNKHCEELFNKIRNRFETITMIDEKGMSTLVPRDARIFNMLFNQNDKETMVTLSLMEPEDLKIYFNRNITNTFANNDKKRWFKFVGDLRAYTVPRQLGFDLVDLDKSGMTVKDIKSLIQDKQSKEAMSESRFAPLSGTKRSSYQALENVRIKVKHADIINDDVHGARSRNIRALFIENNQGERFRFPFVNLAGCRAMARHMDEGGNWNDRVGQRILETTNTLCTIKTFVSEIRSQKICENKTVPLLKLLKEKQVNCRRDLKLMNGSRGYKAYTQNLAETYVEPVTNLGTYFSTIPESVAAMLPLIERILGEHTVDNAVDKSVAECVNWINSVDLTEAPAAPQQPPRPQPAPQAAPQPQRPQAAPQAAQEPEKKPSKLAQGPGKRVQITDGMLRRLGLNKDLSRLVATIPKDEVKAFKYKLESNKLTPPIVIDRQDGTYGFNSTVEQHKFWWLVHHFPIDGNVNYAVLAKAEGSPDEVYGRRSQDRGDDQPLTGFQKFKADIADVGQTYQQKLSKVHDVIDVLSDPIGALGKKITGRSY